MKELNDLMQYAVSLEFNAATKPGLVPVIGISFSNSEFVRQAYRLVKDNYSDKKLTAEIRILGIVLHLKIQQEETGEAIFEASLNYEAISLDEFVKVSPPGQPITFLFGAKKNCEFYVLNPEPSMHDFQPFMISNYQVIR